MKRISYVLVSRNDNYNGDSVGRCVNTVNHACEIIAKNNVVDQSETTFCSQYKFIVHHSQRYLLAR